MKKRVVIALGGNALGKTNEEQLKLVTETSKKIVNIIEKGYEVIITHGNGPQVGMINLAMEKNDNNKIPFPECGAMSQGYIGYQLGQAIQNELQKRKINKKCVTVTTEVLVDENDEAFDDPTKPIGGFYTKEEALALEKENGYIYKEDAGRGYRRVIASPKPLEIIELESIEDLVQNGNIVIACGGGGIPVIRKNEKLVGVDAVIDKDLTSELLAEKLNVDILLILTNIDKVCINFNKKNQKELSSLSIDEALDYIEKEEFSKGSMLPKVEACLKFVKNTNNKAIITSLEKSEDGLDGKAGTVICSNKEEVKEMAEKKETAKRKNFKFGLSAFSIILILIILLGVLTHFLPTAQFVGEDIVNGSGVVKATLADILMSPVKGFADAIDVCIFVFILGGFLNIVTKTGALETGVKVLVQKLKGNELILIPILMFIFSIGGTTYGMLEETVGFYALLAATMVAAGMDTIVASAVVLLGAGCGVLGSTINPFANGAAIDALPKEMVVNQGTIILIGIALWLVSLAISIIFVMLYASKVKKNKGSTFLSLQEQKVMEEKYGNEKKKEEKASLTGKQKVTLILFGLTFLIMIIGFIPYAADVKWLSFTSILTGQQLGNWYFQEASLWFLIMAIIIGIVNGQKESGVVKNFVSGAADMMSVVLIIAVARGASYLMGVTHLDNYIIYNAAEALRSMPVVLFTPLNYILHIILSVLVPSSSGLAGLSAPIMGPLAAQLGYSVEGTIMTFVAANGLVNLITPTCGAIMGGLALAGVEYTTWFKWSIKIIGSIALASVIILLLAMLIF